ncbi:50S ribosomal protein L9 [candidate division KSB1 bacterium]|nr:50S ribosomal protein L9 [candidate division KSB1 bacterium]MCH7753934.1 50S ribosomal protein L9 [candidate division KSB1 bacterium]MCH8018959.1 50S ribosomal protein L9 [candidate division KSB1 bacterium]
MKIILKEDFESLGKVGEVVEVKAGFARNFLIPKQVALQATPQNLRVIEQEKARNKIKLSKDKREAEVLAEQLKKVSLTANVQVGEEDKIFGAVTSQNISELLSAKGFEIDKRKIQLEDPLKALGVFEVPIKLHTEVEAKIKVWVVKE